MDLEHLYPVNNTIRLSLRLNSSLPVVKGLIRQLEIEIQTLNVSNYCKQNTEVTNRMYIPMSVAVMEG